MSGEQADVLSKLMEAWTARPVEASVETKAVLEVKSPGSSKMPKMPTGAELLAYIAKAVPPSAQFAAQRGASMQRVVAARDRYVALLPGGVPEAAAEARLSCLAVAREELARLRQFVGLLSLPLDGEEMAFVDAVAAVTPSQ
jgi:hypothetical protein